MTTYLVLKRSDGDSWMPGDVVVDPIRADLLVQRGYVMRVPDDFEVSEEAKGRIEKRAVEDAERAATEQAAEEERIAKEGEALLLASRPDAARLAETLGSDIDEVFALSDEEYQAGLELLEPETGEDSEAEEATTDSEETTEGDASKAATSDSDASE